MGDSIGLGRKGVSLKTASTFHFVLPDKMRTQIKLICLTRGIEMAQYMRESVIKNNENYKYLIRNVL